MPRFGIEFELVDGTDLNQWEEAFKKPTNMVFIESPSNPSLQVVDIEAVSKLAKKVGAIVAVDNVFATPLGQKPLALGADIVIYSATKHIDGQGRVLGGLILGPRDLLEGKIQYFTRNTGPTLSPFNSWVLLKGLETMDVRLERQCNNAMQIAEFLDQHPKVKKTHYPFLKSHPQYELAKRILKYVGTVVSFDIDGGQVEAFAAMNKLKLFKISNNLGDLHSLSTHPATTTHRSFAKEDWQRISICAGTIRLSVGLEHIEDLKADLTQALG
jgi:O-succinylhomoserine sulfhydrylase